MKLKVQGVEVRVLEHFETEHRALQGVEISYPNQPPTPTHTHTTMDA